MTVLYEGPSTNDQQAITADDGLNKGICNKFPRIEASLRERPGLSVS